MIIPVRLSTMQVMATQTYRHGIAFSEAPLSAGSVLTADDIIGCSVLSSLDKDGGEWWLKHFGAMSHTPYWVEPRGTWALYIDGWRSCKWIATTVGS